MSESENPQLPPPSNPKTAAVPLKKETVRITLRARPGAGTTQPREATAPVLPVPGGETEAIPAKRATAPIQLPSAPLPPPAPKSATAPVKLPPAPMDPARRATPPMVAAPAPSAPSAASAPPMHRPAPPAAPAATVPMTPPRPPGAPPVAPRPPGAPIAAPRPMAPGAAARTETGATTAPLSKPGPRPMGAGTAPMAGAAAGAGVPKATVKLQPTQPMTRPTVSAPPSAPVKRSAAADSEQFYEEKDPEDGLMPLSVVCFAFALVLLVIQMGGGNNAPDFLPEFIRAPIPQSARWEKLNNGVWQNDFSRMLPEAP